jgi:hypothetical protein
MTKLIRNGKALILFALIVVLAMPVISFAQGRGRGRGRGANLDWKCGKFVNCHDARDGRWDGRGPNRSRIGRRISTDDIIFGRRTRRVNRVRIDRDGDGDFDRNDVLLGRQRRVDRDGDGDFDRNDVLLGRRVRRHGRWDR